MNLYNDYSSYLKNKYGAKVYKIGLDAGFGCPGRCAFCNNDGSRSPYTNPSTDIKTQLSERIKFLKKTKDAKKFIAYFQAFTNTYADAGELKKIYDPIRCFEEIVGLSIGTRSDCVDKEKLELIASYKDKYEVWIEYGLQSIHDKTLTTINRGHDFASFMKAYTLTKKAGIKICAHVILGLPGETKNDMIETAKKLTDINIDAVKIHLFHILKGSKFEEDYKNGKIKVLSENEYIELVCDFLENLSKDILIQRLTGEGKREYHIAPLWALDKIKVLNGIKENLKMRNSYQGKVIN